MTSTQPETKPSYPAATERSKNSTAVSRRTFFKLTAAGGAGAMGAGLSGCSSADQTAAPGYQFLSTADMALIRALQPVVLKNAVSADSSEVSDSIFHIIDGSLFLASDSSQADVRKLLDLLHMRLGRWLSTSIWSNWPEAQPEEILAFLDGWRNSHFGTMNAGYRLLTRLVAASYYGQPVSQPSSGYPGPPLWASKALNAKSSSAVIPDNTATSPTPADEQ